MMNELLRVMAQLRDPETGCPWDRAQDSRSLIPYLLEESYEVVEVLEQKVLDPAALRDELGDLLFQVVFHSRVAEEQAWFDFSAVAAGITEKLVRRHPHVFEDTGLGHDPARWDAIKASERQAAGKAAGVLADVPVALPALARADKLGRRAARVGFDWRAAGDVLAKVWEELAEVEDALAAGESVARVEEELGDVLFAAAQLARFLDLDAETALRRANAKFVKRFTWVEQQLAADGLKPEPDHLARMETLWERAKRVEIEEASDAG